MIFIDNGLVLPGSKGKCCSAGKQGEGEILIDLFGDHSLIWQYSCMLLTKS